MKAWRKSLGENIPLIAGIVFAALVFVFFAASGSRAPVTAPTIVPLSLTKMPHGFPDDVTVEPNAMPVKNFNAVSPDGRLQATRIFESSGSVAQNFSFYTAFFLRNAKKGWRIVNQVNEDSHRAIFAENSVGMLAVNLSQAPATKKTIIDLSFITRPPMKRGR